MRRYELMVILDPELEERTVAPSLDTFLNVIRQDGGTRRERRHLGPSSAGLRDRQEARGHLRRRRPDLRAGHGQGAGPSAQPQRVGPAHQGPPSGIRSTGEVTRHRDGTHGRATSRSPSSATSPPTPSCGSRPSGAGRRQLHRRVHHAHCSTSRPTSGRTATPSSCAATCGGSTPRTSPSRCTRGIAGHRRRAGSSSARTRPRKARSAPSSSCEVDEVGPALKYATAKVTKVARGSGGGGVRRRCAVPAATTRGPAPAPSPVRSAGSAAPRGGSASSTSPPSEPTDFPDLSSEREPHGQAARFASRRRRATRSRPRRSTTSTTRTPRCCASSSPTAARSVPAGSPA